MTKLEIITKATLYLDDTSELSTQEFSDLFDQKYRVINSDRPWEGTKAEGTGTTSISVPYVTLASDFLYLTQNYNYTDSVAYESSRPVVFVGSTFDPYQVVSWSDRRRYRDQDGFAYIDFSLGRLVFTKQPTTAKAVEYDYHKQMPVLTDNDEPWFPEEFHDALYHAMCIDDFVIQQSEKAQSYKSEHEEKYKQAMDRMALWNANLIQM